MNMSPSPVSLLFTDLYELTMSAVYHARQMTETATFSLFARDLPQRNFYVAAGLEDALDVLENSRFSTSDIDYLKQTGLFNSGFLSSLEDFQFTGSVFALPEGTLFFPNEPILEVTAPIMEAQIVETFLLNTIGFQSMVATKASRCVYASKGHSVVDFSLRRAPGRDAVMTVPRCVYIAGFDGTSSVLAGKKWGVPLVGTMAHSFVGAFDDEISAFEAFAEVFPDKSVFLIDTYDTLEGAKNAVSVAIRMRAKGHPPIGVRLDSGDMVTLSRQVRRVFDEAGLFDVKIFASGGFDEFKITDSIKAGASIDGFCVGTKMGVSADAPFMDVAYKMVRFGNKNIRKISTGKVSLAGEKQVFRFSYDSGRYKEDIIGMRSEKFKTAQPLLEPVMKNGKRLNSPPSLLDIRERFKRKFSQLDETYKHLTKKVVYPVEVSRQLKELQKTVT